MINIKEPCNENWNGMTSVREGRFCGSCNKVVHDLDKMSYPEILTLLSSAAKPCIKISRNYQYRLENAYIIFPRRSRKSAFRFLGFASLLAFMSSCKSDNIKGEPMRTVAPDSAAQYKELSDSSKCGNSTDAERGNGVGLPLPQVIDDFEHLKGEAPIMGKAVLHDPASFIAETMPEFPGGDQALKKYLSEKIVYESHQVVDTTTVYVRFVVSVEGKATDVMIVDNASHPLNDLIKRVIREMPLWKPGCDGAVPVPVTMVLPIKVEK